MAKEFAKSFYHSTEWQKCRESYIAYRESVDGGMCEICHDVPGFIVHHMTELTPDNINDPDVTLNFDNLKYECLNCHNGIHNPKKILSDDLVRVEFSPDGDAIPIPPKNF